MGKCSSLTKKVQQELSRPDHKAFQKICRELNEISWSSSVEWDDDWGWLILAIKQFEEFGTALRRFRPFRLNSLSDFLKALKLQERFRRHLVEVVPFKIFLGNKIHVPAFSDDLSFLSEADLGDWRKYFKINKFTHNYQSIGVAKYLGVG